MLCEITESTRGEYLYEYLCDLKATHVVVEPSYVDRHFMDDYVGFYARSFKSTVPVCKRVHFFASPSGESIKGRIDSAHESEQKLQEAEQFLSSCYLGFVVVRPLPNARLGRTVLKTYGGDAERVFSAIRPYDVHLKGMRLSVEGLAFQEQDGGAAVCASTAIWSALQQVARLSGHRTPSPIAVTRAADRPYPTSSGMTREAMAKAIRGLGYVVELILADGDSVPFCGELSILLRSRLPVVLLLRKGNLSHAVTVTGFRDNAPRGKAEKEGSPILRGGGMRIVYVHDDNLGPHAHYEILGGSGGTRILRGKSEGGERDWWSPDEWTVTAAMVAKPEKVRLPNIDVLLFLPELQRVISAVGEKSGGFRPQNLVFGAFFCSGVEVERRVTGDKYAEQDAQRWHEGTTLPRHVAVVDISTGAGKDVLQVVVDATTPLKHQEGALALLCPGIARVSRLGHTMLDLGEKLGVDPVFGMPRP